MENSDCSKLNECQHASLCFKSDCSRMIPIFQPSFAENEKVFLNECIDTGWISSQGKFVDRFEEAFANRAGVHHATTASNCTAALHLSMAALGIGPGDEVLCPDLTFIAPANMIALTGARPILVDVEPTSWAIDPELMVAALGPNTKAVVVVHPFGHAADMDPIMEIARAHDLIVIEDVAEAIDATYKGTPVGTIGDVSCYSFFANKIMTTGEGGMVLSKDAAVDKTLRIYRDHGMSRERRYHHVVPGFNYRMTNMQAAIGLAQLERLDQIQAKRTAQAELYAQLFAGNERAEWRPSEDWSGGVHWLATLTLADPLWRDPLMVHMSEIGIEGRPMINPVHEAVHFATEYNAERFPVSRDISHRSLHVPSSTGLTDAEIIFIAESIKAWLAQR